MRCDENEGDENHERSNQAGWVNMHFQEQPNSIGAKDRGIETTADRDESKCISSDGVEALTLGRNIHTHAACKYVFLDSDYYQLIYLVVVVAEAAQPATMRALFVSCFLVDVYPPTDRT